MSFRTWLGPDKMDWADYNLCDFDSIEKCAEAGYWKMPAKVYATHSETLQKYLDFTSKNGMSPSEFWEIGIYPQGFPGHLDSVAHPDAEELEKLLQPKPRTGAGPQPPA